MRQPGTTPDPRPEPEATEVVTRPDPGLARGRWEAPAWFFWVVLVVVVAAAAAYAARRLGLLRPSRPKDPK